MTNTLNLRLACAGLALSFAAQAGATDLWINSDSRSRESMLGSVVLLEVGTTNTCIVCKVQPSPRREQPELAPRDSEPDFYESLNRRREGKTSVASSPPPARFASDSSPSIANDSWRAIASPSPVPPVSRLREASSR